MTRIHCFIRGHDLLGQYRIFDADAFEVVVVVCRRCNAVEGW